MDSSTRAPQRRPEGRLMVVALIVLVGLTSGCGPSPDDIAATALASAPISYALALLAVWALHGLWRAQIGSVQPRWGLALVYAVALSAVALIVTREATIETDVFAVAAFLSTSTSVSVSMLVGRLGLGVHAASSRAMHDYGRSVTVAPALVTAVVYAPFLLTWLESGAPEEFAFTVALALVGVGGTYVAGPLILGLVVETVFARSRVATAAE